MVKQYTFSIFILSALAFAGCGGGEDKALMNDDVPVQVTVSQPVALSGNDFAALSGKLVAKNSVDISTRMMGYIVKMNTDIGQTVKTGQLLLSINAADLDAKRGRVRAQIAMARAHYNNAKKDYDRFQNLFKTESASQKELDDMTTRYESAKAALNAAEQMEGEVNSQFNYANITAPISGIVTARFAGQGDLANPGMPLLTIESPTVLQARILVSEKDIIRIKTGDKVQVTVNAVNKTIPGAVAEISKSSANTGGQYLVKIGLQSTTDLLPGMFVNVRLPLSGAPDRHKTDEARSVMVPDTALVKNGQLTGIYVVSGQNTAVLRWLKTGRKLGSQTEILSGLKEGEPYILSAGGRLYNGVRVTVK